MPHDSMKAIVISRPGGPDVLELREVPRPVPAAGRVLVQVAAAGVNRADLLQRRGGYPAPDGWPADIPGLEFAGTVAAAGSGCSLFGVGDRVMGVVGGGGYAEFVELDERAAVRVPPGLTDADAGAVPEAFMTAFDALDLQMGLVAGESVLIHAVGSGVGTAALQLARVAGAFTVGTSRTVSKLEGAQELGLDAAVVGGTDSWPERVLEATAGRGVDVILDLVGAAYMEGNLEVLAPHGRWIIVGTPGGSSGVLDLGRLMRRWGSIRGTLLRSRPPEEKAVLARTFEERVVPLFERGSLRPVLDRSYPAAQAADAHRRLESNESFGKVLLTWE